MADGRSVTVSLIPIHGIGEATAGDDVATLLVEGLASTGETLRTEDVVVVTHKLVSKAEGRVVDLHAQLGEDLAGFVDDAIGQGIV